MKQYEQVEAFIMRKPAAQDQLDVQTSRSALKPRLRALLFGASALGTALVALGPLTEVKLPPYHGE